MGLVEIEKGIFVEPSDVSSIEDHDYWGSRSPSDSFLESSGSRIILKNGLKIYVKCTRAIDVHDMLFRPIKDVVPAPDAPRAILIPSRDYA